MANLPVPSPRTFGVSEVEDAAYLNSIRDALLFLLNPPHAVLTQGSATTSLAANGWTSLGFDTTIVDSYGGHSNVTNNSRYTAIVAGWYLVAGGVSIATNASSSRGVRAAKNGAAIQGTQQLLPPSGALPTSLGTIPQEVFLNAGDYVEIQAFPGTGILSTQIGTDGSASSMTVVYKHA